MSETLVPQKLEHHLQNPVQLSTASVEGQDLLGSIYRAESLLEDSVALSDEAVAPKSKLFLSTQNLKDKKPDIILNADNFKDPIQVPLDLVVDAEGFTNWQGRGKGINKTISTDEGYLTLPSHDIIVRYANMPTEAPVIPEFDMYVQPNGKIFFGNSNDGSHRLAAAIMKGKKTVPTLSLRVRHIQDDIF